MELTCWNSRVGAEDQVLLPKRTANAWDGSRIKGTFYLPRMGSGGDSDGGHFGGWMVVLIVSGEYAR